MDKELLLKYKEQNPEKFAQKFGHLNLDEIEATAEVVVEEKKKVKSSFLQKIKKLLNNE